MRRQRIIILLFLAVALTSCSPGHLGGTEIAFVRDGHLWTIDPDGANAFEVAAMSGGTVKYSLGSVLNHVLMHQTIIEILMQLERAGGHPDVAIGCTGGGSDFAGLAFPFIGKKLREGLKTRILAVEPMTCPSLTKGLYAYDFGDTVGMSPLVSQLHDEGVIDARLSPDSDLPGSCAVRARRGHRSRAGLRVSR